MKQWLTVHGKRVALALALGAVIAADQLGLLPGGVRLLVEQLLHGVKQ